MILVGCVAISLLVLLTILHLSYEVGYEDGRSEVRKGQMEMCERCGKTKWGRIDTDTDEVL